MVQAIMAGRKTQTRRALKLPIKDRDVGCELAGCELAGSERDTHRHCPYGQPGDRLWVKETWAPNPLAPKGAEAARPYVLYRANGDTAPGWRPSIFMSRRSSRITLEVTAVRVERLNAINAADAIAEGIEERYAGQYLDYDWKLKDGSVHTYGDPRESYRSLWQAINGPGSWAVNPWVWVVEFRRIAP